MRRGFLCTAWALSIILASTHTTTLAQTTQRAPPARQVMPPEMLSELDDATLMQMYAENGPGRSEIIRRGARMLPLIRDLVMKECWQERLYLGPTAGGNSNGYYYHQDTPALLAEIPDVRSAKLLLEVMRKPIATEAWRSDALSAIERLTYLSPFRLDAPFGGDNAVSAEDAIWTPEHRSVWTEDPYARVAVVAFYHDWLSNEGRDPARWLPLAQQRGRRVLEGGDLTAIFCVVRFFQRGPERDDQPAKTMARVAQILDEAVFKGKRLFSRYPIPVHSYRGQELPNAISNWMPLLSHYGPAARPYVKTLIRMQEEIGLHDVPSFRAMAKIGGNEVIAHFEECLPRIQAEIARLGELDHPARTRRWANLPEDWEASSYIQCEQLCRSLLGGRGDRALDSDHRH